MASSKYLEVSLDSGAHVKLIFLEKSKLNESDYQCERSIWRSPRGHTKGTGYARMLHHRAHNQKEHALH